MPTIVNTCVALGCKSGYRSNKETDLALRVTFHSFPKDAELCQKWINANPRKGFGVSQNSKMCSLYFKASDFVCDHSDTNEWRIENYQDTKLKKGYLKKTAVPSLFPNAPSYLSTPEETPSRGVSATATGRLQRESDRLEQLEEAFVMEDSLLSLSLNQI